ncbi:transcriptional regulator with XRE-family HTH domain [Streptomyces sp. SAI-170]|uniref:helix-turn-helix domain-containing protein n=1 Tax=Streptomyces sp. SAI-170 TaxID=3377729 RepID=UPI003C7E728A
MSESTAAADFAALLRELKVRSGLSYGALAKRLHLSTSTLHRYCNGDAVPADYAPVERLARLCRATSEELVALHRRWVLADAERGRRTSAGPAPAVDDEVSAPATPAVQEETTAPAPPAVDNDEEATAPSAPAAREAGGSRPARPRRRTAVAVGAGIAVAGVFGAVALAVGPSSGGEDGGGRGPVAAASHGGGAHAGTASGSAPASPAPSAPASVSASASATTSPGANPTGAAGKPSGDATPGSPSAPAGGGAAAAEGPPLTVTTEPYAWEDPCSQRYLVDGQPDEVSPPPVEDNASAWVGAMRAVSSGEQYVKLTVQGTGEETVVVDGLSVRTAGRSAPLAWNDYAMGYPGVGCGGDVPVRSFTVALDAARPAVQPVAGHRDFPFKVSESDPEVYYVKADASAYDVRWYLVLSWSSGGRHGTLTVDDQGRPFRTSGNNGRPAYEFPLGGEGWVPEGTTPR